MNQVLLILRIGCVTAFLVLVTGCYTIPKTDLLDQERLANSIHFENIEKEDVIPFSSVLYLSDKFIQQLPRIRGGQENLWQWIFKNAVDSLFQEVTIVNRSTQLDSLPDNTLIIQPELWGYFFRRYGPQWKCWFDFKFSLYDAGHRQSLTNVKTNATSTGADLTETFSTTMNQIIRSLQERLLHQWNQGQFPPKSKTQ